MKRVMVLAVILMTGAEHAGRAQDACRAPDLAPSQQANLFTEAQEAELGDILADTNERAFGVIDDEALTAPLRQMGERLMRHLPPTKLRIRFSLIDIPIANAFAFPGGRIFVTRKLVAFSQSEDELAGILGHELGHLVARHGSLEFSRQLREILGVTQLGDRQDIFEKYNRLMDNAARKPGAFRAANHESRDQVEADRLGLFVVTAAGYDAKAQIAMFDRLAETQGNTGSFFSTLFGTTNPDAKRLGEMMRTAAQAPAGCAQPAPRDPAVFKQWQAAVMTFSGSGRRESLQGVAARVSLAPALRGEVMHLRFSPDGRHVLAQDEAGISVLSRDPFRVLFRIDTTDARPAQFTPDSRSVAFHTLDLRVDRWNLADRKLASVRDLYRRTPCIETALAPDAGSIACVDANLDLSLIDVQSGTTLFQKKAFAGANALFVAETPLQFSPDGRFLIAGYYTVSLYGPVQRGALVYDMPAKKTITLREDSQLLLTTQFAFLGPDRVIGLNPLEPQKSGILTLPAGQVTERIGLSIGDITAATKGNFVFLRPFQKYAVGVLNLATQTVVKGNPLEAFDMYDDVFVAERGTGDIGLYTVEGNKNLASVSLPESSFGRLNAIAVSPDFRWLAVSERSRGAIWDLASGTRTVQVRGFRGAVFDDAGILHADMPAGGGEPRSIMRINPESRQLTASAPIKERAASQRGRLLMTMRPIPANVAIPTGGELELRDIPRNMMLWVRSFPKDPPTVWVNPAGDSVVLGWLADSQPGRDRIREDERLRRTTNMGDLLGDYVLDVFDSERGVVRARMLLETGKGSFRPANVYAAGDWLVVRDTLGRILVFSLTTGELSGYALGLGSVANVATGLLAVDSGHGRVSVHDLKTMARLRDYTFSHSIEYAAFNPAGTLLLAVAADQKAYVLNQK